VAAMGTRNAGDVRVEARATGGDLDVARVPGGNESDQVSMDHTGWGRASRSPSARSGGWVSASVVSRKGGIWPEMVPRVSAGSCWWSA
jgi:hypothetical protein